MKCLVQYPFLSFIDRADRRSRTPLTVSFLLLFSSTLTVIVFSLLTALFYLSLYKYFPAHFAFLRRRSAYYLYGDETIPVFTLDSESVLSRWRVLVTWSKRVLGHKGNVTSESLKDAAWEISRTIAETASQAMSSTASAVGETAKVEL
jgi:hypothetical protein